MLSVTDGVIFHRLRPSYSWRGRSHADPSLPLISDWRGQQMRPSCPADTHVTLMSRTFDVFVRTGRKSATYVFEVSRCVFPHMRPSCPADTQVSFELPPMRPSCLADTHVTLMSRTFDVFVRTGRKSVTYVLEVSRRVFPHMRPSCPADTHVSLLSRTFDVIVRTCRRSVT